MAVVYVWNYPLVNLDMKNVVFEFVMDLADHVEVMEDLAVHVMDHQDDHVVIHMGAVCLIVVHQDLMVQLVAVMMIVMLIEVVVIQGK